MTPFLIVLALICTPFTWVIVAGAVIAVIVERKPETPKRRHPHRLPRRTTTPYLARMTMLTQIAEQKERHHG